MTLYTLASIVSDAVPISFGRDNMVPTKLEIPLKSPIIPRLMIFPMASCPRFIGVTNKVAMVPLSFSPAMDSGAIAIHPEKRNIISSIGSIMEKICPVLSSLLARSYSVSPLLTSNLFAIEASYPSNTEAII